MFRFFLSPKTFFIALMINLNLCAIVFSNEEKPLDISKDWSAFKCYTVTGAIEMLAFKNGEKLSKVSREKGRLYVQMADAETGQLEVSYFAGFPLRVSSQVALDVDKQKKFVLYSHPSPNSSPEKSYAWSHPNDDEKLIAALKKGETAVIEATSHTGKVIKDTFALSGFTSSLSFMKKTCK